MKKLLKEKKNFTFTVGLLEEFNDRCVPQGSNASVEIERLLRAEIRRQDTKKEIVDYLFSKEEAMAEFPTIMAMMRGANLLEGLQKKNTEDGEL